MNQLKLTIELNATTPEELAEKLAKLSTAFAPAQTVVGHTSLTQENFDTPSPSVLPEPAVAQETGKRGRKPGTKQKKVEEQAQGLNENSFEETSPVEPVNAANSSTSTFTDAPAPVKAAASPAPTVTKDQIIAKLQAVNESKGFDSALKALKEVGAERVSEVQPGDYQRFIDVCDKVLA